MNELMKEGRKRKEGREGGRKGKFAQHLRPVFLHIMTCNI